jgi:predicted nucleic acid-binding protein
MTDSKPIEALYVLVTVTLIRYMTKSKDLGTNARMVFEAAERSETQLVLSAISLAELYYSNVKNGWFSDFDELYAELKASQFSFLPFNADDVADFKADAAVPEMHDRIIAGLARRLGVPLITNDHLIIGAGIVTTVW